MVRHIFKISWNERKINAWLVAEYIIIFCVLWFCCDYLYPILRNYYGPQGFDIEHVYLINMGKKPSGEKSEEIDDYTPAFTGVEKKSSEGNSENSDEYTLAMIFMERVKRYPDIEKITFARVAIPYAGNVQTRGYMINSDSVYVSIRQRFVSTDFFDVFKIKVDGQIFDWTDNAAKDDVIISALSNNKFGDVYDNTTSIPISDVHTVNNSVITHKIIGKIAVIKDPYFQAHFSNVIMPLERGDVDLGNIQIAVRVKPEADKNFTEKFTKDMRDQLLIGPYYLSSVVSIKEMKTQADSNWGARDKINSAFAITLFLVVNIFLGILGSFWFRTQSRRSELGLRIALGSSKGKVRGMVVLETMMLLFIASIIGTIICLNFGSTETLRSLGIPTLNKEAWGIGKEQNFINFAITFTFLAVVSVIAVWYPAKQASNIQPAEALRDE
jgi:ABC-type transport system, involved in lipoprotein release, permease component